ncbi:MAG TPA: hypothetical protein VGP64_17755 [Polyangia bacterium]
MVCLTWSADDDDWSGPVAAGSAEIEEAESSSAACANAGPMIAPPQTTQKALKKIAALGHKRIERLGIYPSD